MALTPAQAAAAVGMTKAGIIRAIHSGKLSATRNDSGHFEIEPVELFRVYDPVSTGDNSDEEVADNSTPDQSDKVEMLERIIRDKDEVIADLRRRLDQATEENNRLSLVLTSQLSQPQPAHKNWWARLLGGG